MSSDVRKTVGLGLMMFLHFMMMPVWFVPMLPYVNTLSGSEPWVLWFGLIMGFGTFTSPLFGMFADRFLNAEKVLALCDLMTAGLLTAAFFTSSPAWLFVLLMLTMAFSMPTWSLTATIALSHVSPATFTRLRIFGTIGWVASGVFSCLAALCFGFNSFDSSPWIFVAGAGTAVVAALVCLVLPPTAPGAKGQPLSVVDALGLRALVLFKDRAFALFAILLLAAMVPFQWYNVYGVVYLKESGFQYLTMTMNLGQAGEIGFMLLIPWIMKRFGYKRALMLALAALAFRNACFLVSSLTGAWAFDFGGILIHGLIFGLLIIGSQIYIDEIAPKELRNQAQGLVNLLTAGVGVFASNFLFDTLLAARATVGTAAWTRAYGVAVAVALTLMVVVGFLFPTRRPTAAATGASADV